MLNSFDNKIARRSWNCERTSLKSFDKLLIIASLLVYNVTATDTSDSVVFNGDSYNNTQRVANHSRLLGENENVTSQSVDSSQLVPVNVEKNGTYHKSEELAEANDVWLSNALFESLSTYVPSSPNHPNSKCTADGLVYKRNLENLTLWAVKMYDAGVHFPEGLLSTDTYQLGHFDECLNVSYPSHNIEGRYCLATLLYAPSRNAHPVYYDPPAPVYYQEPPPDTSVWNYLKRTLDPRIKYRDEIHFGVCVPASCSLSDVESSLNSSVVRSLQKNSLIGQLSIQQESCYDKKERPYDTGFIAMLATVIGLVMLSFFGTLYDYLVVQKRTEAHESGDLEKTILSFSIKENAEELLSPGPIPEFDAINGGKVITIFFVILGHRILYAVGSAIYNPIYWEEIIRSMFSMTFLNATHIVDTFFLSGGFLAFHGLYKELEKTKRFNLLSILILRYFRIMPVYAFMMGIYAFTLMYMGQGPIWNLKVGLESDYCHESWWLNMLFLNNYFNTERECLIMSWYIACDMHFFIIGSILIYLLWKNPKVGELLCIVVLIVSICIPFIATYIGNHDGKLRLHPKLFHNLYLEKEYTSVYIKSHFRSIPYMFGVVLGYISLKMKTTKFVIPKWALHIGSYLFILAYAVQIYSLVIYIPGRPYDALENATFAAMLPLTWSIGVGWIIMVQYTTGFSVYNFFFVKKIYAPLSRLVYCVVLIHPAVQFVQSASNRNPEYFTVSKLIWMTFGDVSLSYFLATIMYLLVEAPLRTVVKLWIQGTRNRRRREN